MSAENSGGESRLLDRGRAATGDVTALGIRGARRALLAVQIRRLEARANAGITRLGHDVLALITAGQPVDNSPQVRERVAAISAIHRELMGKRAEMTSLSAERAAWRASMEHIDSNATHAASAAQSASDEAAETAGNPAEQGGEG
jgi:GGDEF domain-containing protein